MNEQWITMADEKVCDDCEHLSGQIDTAEHWDATGRPGHRGTQCGPLCRCELFPELPENEQEFLDRIVDAIEAKASQVILDETSGTRIALKDYDGIGLGKLTYDQIAEFEGLVRLYNESVGTLPAEFYALADIKRELAWLRERVGD
jgi:hypothetical protein